MNAILSILVCFAMLFSGGAALPEQPETATTWTLRNLSITTDEGSATLTPELRLTTALGSEAALLQFEVANGGDVLLPVAGELTNDGVRFRLSEDGSVYSLSNDALLELMEADAEELLPLTYMADYLNSYSALLQRSMNDASFQQKASQVMTGLLVSACGGETEPFSVGIDGADVPALRVELELTPEGLLNLLDGLASCGIAEIEDMLDSYMLLFSAAMDEDYASLSDFTAELRELLAEEDMEDSFSLPMELCWTTEAPGYLEAAMDCAIDDTSSVLLDFTEIFTEERTDLDMTLILDTDDGMGSTNSMEFRMAGYVNGPANAPESVELNLAVSSQSGWESEYEEEDAMHSFTSDSSTDFSLDLSAEVVDGLEHATIDFEASQSSSYDYDGDVSDYESELSAYITADDSSEDDGSVTTAVTIDVDVDDESVSISYELNRAEGAPVPSFDESKTVDLAEALGEDEGGDGSVALTSDLLRLSADATTLCADESVAAMLELLGIDPDAVSDDDTLYEDYDDEYEYDDEYDYDDDYDYHDYDYDDDIVTVYSMDEAEPIYGSALPSFTVPDDLALDSIDVSESYLDASYCSDDGERSMDLSFYDYGESQGEYYVLEDGALKDADVIVSIEAMDEEGTMFSADVGRANGLYSFYFYGFAQEEVEAVLASLQF